MVRFYILFASILLANVSLSAQSGCSDPIQVFSIETNPACAGDNGSIVVNIAPGAYAWTWTPSVSFGPVANNLAPGNYTIHIERNGQPECAYDTTIAILSYPQPPVPQVVFITASNCFASNGAVQLAPAEYQYAWSNTEVGAFNDGLNSGTYGVTATDPNTGCRATITVDVPNNNPLNFTANVTQPSKCGRNTGVVAFDVFGGSGQYSYSLGGQQVFGMPPGENFGVVVDNTNGCADTAFFDVPVVVAEGTVIATVNPPRCNGGVGNLQVDVLPGDNFKSPYTFSVTTSTGIMVPKTDSLPAGDYLIYVSDADSCLLPAQPFMVFEPSAIELSPMVMPGNCDDGGTLILNASGGIGALIADWEDLSGVSNGFARNHLADGVYSVTVYDSLFCKASLSNIALINNCGTTDTLGMLVAKNSNASFCLPSPEGLLPTEATYTLLGSNTTSTFGGWALFGGCLTYMAGSTTGFDVDVICVKIVYPSLNFTDTVCISVSILENTPTKEKVSFTVQVNATAPACGTVPTGITNPKVKPLNIPDLNGNTPFGVFNVHPTNACMTYTAFETPQFFADSIAVAVCDPASFRCHIICYLPSILPFTDCSQGIVALDTVQLPTTECEIGASTCIQIPYANILNFNIIDNNQPYALGALGCNDAPVVSYPVSQVPFSGAIANGPYYLEEWFINGNPNTGTFADLNELVSLMNQIDPQPGWYLENGINIIGGKTTNNYGPLRISSNSGQSGQAQASLKTAPLGSELRFTTGDHKVILKRIQTGCSDTFFVKVQCFDCPPIHNYIANQFGNIEWEAPSCASDTLFQTNILLSELGKWELFDNNQPLVALANGNNAAFRLDTGFHLMRLYNKITTCEYFVSFFSDCRNAPVDTIFATVKVGETQNICPIPGLVPDPIITIFHICPDRNLAPNVAIAYDETNWCAVLEGEKVGLDTLCLQVCNADGICATTLVFVEVTPGESNDKVLVFNGISPNGDSKNDVWRIVGIDDFPDNEVWIYNRNGNEVFNQKNYNNEWDGTWNEKTLPAGTYYYVVDLGDGSNALKGYLQINY
jgi:gliding motility-associated-like protein